MTEPTASAQKAAAFAARMALELDAYARRYGLALDGSVAASGATLTGTIGAGRAKHDLEALMRRWGGQFTATENADGTLTIAGQLAVEAWTPPDATTPPLYVAPAFAPDTLPDGWAWGIGLGATDGTVAEYPPGSGDSRLRLTPAPAGTQLIDLGYREPDRPITALSVRLRLRLATFDPLHDSFTLQLRWDAGLPITLATQVDGTVVFSSANLDTTGLVPAPLPTPGVDHWVELLMDTTGGKFRARYYLDGVEALNLIDNSDRIVDDFSSVGYQITTSVGAGEGVGVVGPVVYLDAVTVSDGYQGVPG